MLGFWYQSLGHDTTECKRLARLNDDMNGAVEPPLKAERRKYYDRSLEPSSCNQVGWMNMRFRQKESSCYSDLTEHDLGWGYKVMMLERRDGDGGRHTTGSISSMYAERVAVGSTDVCQLLARLVWKEVILGQHFVGHLHANHSSARLVTECLAVDWSNHRQNLGKASNLGYQPQSHNRFHDHCPPLSFLKMLS